ncbi:hypothetical protein F5888DRAFT_656335 [Russula emetica]|nr:hypothetical protein F5888DRAFT_656335 [Russula emetica]
MWNVNVTVNFRTLSLERICYLGIGRMLLTLVSISMKLLRLIGAPIEMAKFETCMLLLYELMTWEQQSRRMIQFAYVFFFFFWGGGSRDRTCHPSSKETIHNTLSFMTLDVASAHV